MANWLFDAACLYVCLQSYNGDHISAPLVLTAYGFASLVGLLPLTPGGLGVIEGTLIPLLIALGTSSPVAVLGVLTWRVLQFWLPVAVAALCYLALRLTGRLGRRESPMPARRQGGIRIGATRVRNPLGTAGLRPSTSLTWETQGFPFLGGMWCSMSPCVALTIAVFAVLALILRGLERL